MTAKLAGRTAIVTGAGRGIGRAIALQLASEGAAVVLAARTEAEISAVCAEVQRAGGHSLAVAIDISRAEQVEAMVERTRRELGPASILVCNAGMPGPVGRLVDIEPAAWEQTLAVNLTGVFLCARAVIRDMEALQWGKIITISSGVAQRPVQRIAAYSASKAGMTNLTHYLADELDEHGVDVNAVRPGIVRTSLSLTHLASGPEKGGALVAHVTRGLQDGGTPPERTAQLVAFLASHDADGISGQFISVDDDVTTLPRRPRRRPATKGQIG